MQFYPFYLLSHHVLLLIFVTHSHWTHGFTVSHYIHPHIPNKKCVLQTLCCIFKAFIKVHSQELIFILLFLTRTRVHPQAC